MTWLWITITTALATFAATNIDDIVILMLFFSQTTDTFRRRHIVLGQYLGFVALVAVSLIGFAGSLFVPRPWIGLLGLAPIMIGVRKLTQNSDETSPAVQLSDEPSTGRPTRLWQRQTFSVAAVTFANGGDNISIYVPFFASTTITSLIVILALFLVLVGVWCYLGYRLTRQPWITQTLTRYGHVLVPLVLISLGLYIIVESGTMELLGA